jgi:hypothetical protein
MSVKMGQRGNPEIRKNKYIFINIYELNFMYMWEQFIIKNSNRAPPEYKS